MNRRAMYEMLAATTLALGGLAAFLAVAGAAFQQALGVAAASLCAGAFVIPGLYFLGFSRRLRAREAALAHAAAFARSRGNVAMRDLADELNVSSGDAEKILRTAVEEGYLAGRFESSGRFVAKRAIGSPEEGEV